MARRGGGAIVNQSSTAAWLYSGFYGLAKVGINGLTQQLAHELGGQQHPGQRHRPRPDRHRRPPEKQAGAYVDQELVVRTWRIKRKGTVGDMAGACLFLLSDDAAWVTGQVLERGRRADLPLMTDRDPAAGVGFIGLGQIGAPMATRWLDWPGGLTVYDVHAPATEPFAAGGATSPRRPPRSPERALVISVMVQRRRPGRMTCMCRTRRHPVGGRAGTVVVIHSTVEADTPARLAELATPEAACT
jgi:hypothetical protein